MSDHFDSPAGQTQYDETAERLARAGARVATLEAALRRLLAVAEPEYQPTPEWDAALEGAEAALRG